jgi:uncharacterized protein YndB with AHSA1/START domain
VKTPPRIEVQQTIELNMAQTWELLVVPNHLQNWYFAHESWHVPYATVDLKVGGEFHIQMEAKDQSEGFDFWGTYHTIEPYAFIECVLGDGRYMSIQLRQDRQKTQVIQTFEIEFDNDVALQQAGWQAILDQLKEYSKSFK